MAAGSSGTWSATTSWSTTSGGATGASIPGNGDQAIFDGKKATPCILTAAVSVSSVTIGTSTVGGFSGYIDLSTRTFTVQQNFTLNHGTFYARTSSVTVGGNWFESNAASFVANTSSVTFASTTANHTIDTGGDPFYKLIFSGANGGWTTMNDPVTVSSFTTMLGGSLVVADSSMSVAGDFQVTAGSTLTINHDLLVGGGNVVTQTAGMILANSTSTLTLSGTGTLGGGTGRLVLPNVVFTGNAQTTTLASIMNLQGGLTNTTGHTLDVSASNFAISVSSGWNNTGTYTARSGSVTFVGAGTDQLIATNGKPFFVLRFNGSGNWLLPLNAPVTVSSNVLVDNGTFGVTSSSLTMTGSLLVTTLGTLDIENDILVNGSSMTNTGTITSLSTPTVTLVGNGTLGGVGITQLPNLTLNTAAKTTTLLGPITLLGSLTNSSTHILDPSASNFALTIGGSWANAGTFTARSSSVTFNGSAANSHITTNNSAFYNLRFNGTGSWSPLTNAITVSSNVMIDGGTFNVAGTSLTTTGSVLVTTLGTLNVLEDILVNGSSMTNTGTITTTLSTPTVTLVGNGTLGGTGNTLLPNLTLNTAAKTTTLLGPVSLLGTMTNSASHVLDPSVSNYGITTSGNWANAGTFTARSSSVTFTGSTANGTIQTNNSPFFALDFEGGTWRNLTNVVTVSNNLTINGGSFNVGGSSMSVGGDVAVNSGGTLGINHDVLIAGDLANDGTITPIATSTPTVTQSGTGIIGGNGATSLPRITWNGAGTTTLNGDIVLLGSATLATGHTLDTSVSGYQITISSWFADNGTFTPQLGTVVVNSTATLTGATTFYNLTATTPGITITFQKGATTYIEAALTLAGAAGNRIALRSTTAGSQAELDVEGSASLSQVDVKDNDARSGLTLSPTNSLDSGNNRNWDFGTNAVRTWWGAVNTDWTNINNWDSIVPGLGDKALIVSTATHMPTLTANVLTSTVSIVATSSLSLNGFDMTISSLSNAGILVLQGSENVTAAPDNILGSTVIYNATSGSGVIYATWTYANLVVGNGGAATFTPTSDLTVKQGLTLSAGKFINNGNDLTFAGTAGTWGITNAGNPFNNVTFNGSGGTWILVDSMTVASTMTITAGTLNTRPVTNNGILVGGEWVVNGGGFIANASSVTFAGSATNQRIRSGNQNFWKLIIAGPGSWVTNTNAVTVGSTVFVNGGQLTIASGSSMTVTGTMSVANGATLDIEEDTLIGSGTLTNAGLILNTDPTAIVTLGATAGTLGGAGGTVLPGVTMTGAVTTTLAGPVTIQGTMTNPASHTLDPSASNYGITMLGNWANAGTYTTRASSVTFAGTTPSGTITTNNSAFSALAFNGGVWRNVTNPVTVVTNVTMNGGTFNLGGSSLTVSGDVDVNAGATLNIGNNLLINGGDFTNDGTVTSLTTATVSLNGTGTLGGAGSTNLPITTLGGAAQTTTLGGDVVFVGSATIATGHTLDVSASAYQITVSSWFANNGTFTPRPSDVVVNSTAAFTGSTTFYNFIATTPGITMTFQAGATQYVTNSFNVAGAAGNRTKFRSTGTTYVFRVAISSFVSNVDVQNCYASSQTLYAGQASIGSGTGNWVFDYPPNAIATLDTAPQLDGTLNVLWTSAGDSDDNPLGVGSQYVIEWATFSTVAWSTSTAIDTGQQLTHHIFISTSGVHGGDSQVYVSTGLSGGGTYYFQIWTKDPTGIWSFGLSNQPHDSPAAVLGMSLNTHTYDFGTVNMAATTVSTSALTVSNIGNVTETYSLSVATSGASGIWGVNVATPTVMDRFALFGGFNATAPAATAFNNVDVITNTPTASAANVYAQGQSGVSTAIGSTRDLWFRLDMPPTTSTTSQQQMTVTVTASTP